MAQKSFLNAVKWAYTANWGERAFAALFTFLLAAILGPRDFGVVSLAMVYIAFVQMLLNQGLMTALVQRKELEDTHLDTVFWTNVALSVGLAGLSVLFSRWWASINHLPELVAIISTLSLCIPIEGLAIVQIARLQRQMDFKTLSLRANASVLVGGTVGVVMAYLGYGVWALVGQQIAKDLAALALLWQQGRWRPRVHFSWKHLRDLMGFSTSNFISQLAIFFDAQAGAILMGTLFGPIPVGLYRIAERLVSSVTAVATSSIQSVSLPEFSRLQDRPEELRKSILTCVRLAATVTLPAMAGLFVVSGTMMNLMGPKWVLASGVLKILSILGMLMLFVMFTGPLLQALSRPHHHAILEWTRTVVGSGLLIAAGVWARHSTVEWQVNAIALARFAMVAVFVTPVFLYLLLHLGRISVRELLKSITPAFASATAVFISVYFLYPSRVMAEAKPAIQLCVQVVIGSLCGLAILLLLDRQLRAALLALVQRRTGRLAISNGVA
jgi:O-antigen/teichoic acid export membrane protein